MTDENITRQIGRRRSHCPARSDPPRSRRTPPASTSPSSATTKPPPPTDSAASASSMSTADASSSQLASSECQADSRQVETRNERVQRSRRTILEMLTRLRRPRASARNPADDDRLRRRPDAVPRCPAAANPKSSTTIPSTSAITSSACFAGAASKSAPKMPNLLSP